MSIPDKAVEALVEVLRDRQVQRPVGRHLSDIARAGLEAAEPYLTGPEVVVDHRPGETCSVAAEVDPETGFARPLLDREAVRQLLQAADGDLAGYPDRLDRVTDLVLELSRPMPTREQIAEALHDHWTSEHSWRQGCRDEVCIAIFTDRADAVLALLNGAES